MKTTHKIFFMNSQNMEALDENSIDIMVTSPPYPMIEMWDKVFSEINPRIKCALDSHESNQAFELMHNELNKVWMEVYRVLKWGGIACINIGDATRTFNGTFQLFNSHSRILTYCSNIGFQVLPCIIWRKQTNAPNKFMGSGMLPTNAYVTLEHECILLLRKGPKRKFDTTEERRKRRESAYFWEERNLWYSDVWTDLKGTRQSLNAHKLRSRSGAFPFELAYRLICMFSIKGDTILDPFLGTGTTSIASIAAERNSIGVEINENFKKIVDQRIMQAKLSINKYISERITRHLDFVRKRKTEKGGLKYDNKYHNFPVVTRQECRMMIKHVHEILRTQTENSMSGYEVLYKDCPASANLLQTTIL